MHIIWKTKFGILIVIYIMILIPFYPFEREAAVLELRIRIFCPKVKDKIVAKLHCDDENALLSF